MRSALITIGSRPVTGITMDAQPVREGGAAWGRRQVTSKIDIFSRMSSAPGERGLDIDALTTAIEDFTTIFIRLPSVRRLNFSALSVLHTLARNGPMRLTALTATEQLKQPALTSLAAKLERDGLVARRPDPRDGRAVLLSLTQEGRDIVESRHADRMAKLGRLVARLGDQERETLTDATRVLVRLTEIAAADEAGATRAGDTNSDDITR